MDVCEYIYVLDFGKLLFEGEPPNVAASPEVQAAYLGYAVAEAAPETTAAAPDAPTEAKKA